MKKKNFKSICDYLGLFEFCFNKFLNINPPPKHFVFV